MKAFRKMLQRTPFYGVYKSLGHYPDYWYWKLRGEPIRSPHLLKQRTVRDYAQRYGLRVLVETGTYYGEMVEAMKGRKAEKRPKRGRRESCAQSWMGVLCVGAMPRGSGYDRGYDRI